MRPFENPRPLVRVVRAVLVARAVLVGEMEDPAAIVAA
jgi:hypothetical protein